jgi:multiple sugar transport system ATP-binding protein
MIYVTHDQIEALTLADRVAVMHGGLIQQLAPPKEIYRKPVNLFVAGFVGSPAMNFLAGRISKANGGVGIKLDDGTDVALAGYEFAGQPQEGQPALLGVRPEQIMMPGADGASNLPITVTLVDSMGADALLWGTVGKDVVSVRIGSDDTFAMGDQVTAGFQPALASLFDAESGNRL